MAQIVRTIYLSSFQMPGTCVSCGAPADPALSFRVEKTQYTQVSARGTYTPPSPVLLFPICAECQRVNKYRNRINAGFVAVVLNILMGACLFFLWRFIPEQYVEMTIVSFLVLVLTVPQFIFWIARLINERGFTLEEKQRRKNLAQAVLIKKFKAPGVVDKMGFIEFAFENISFATSFATLNKGLLH